jgi:dihydrofolate reductase
MRKIIVTSFITLDGVMQAPGGGEEDFNYGGWSAPYYDEVVDEVSEKNKKPAADFLLGRKTFEIFASFFPEHPDIWPSINEGTKYVMSKTMKKSDPIAMGWKNTVFIDSLEDIKKLKDSEGPDIQVSGSGQLIQLLLKHDLVDELWLLIHPVSLGEGKKLFGDGTIPAAFTLTETVASPSGVIIANYKRAGEVKTGAMG